jgi:hypothetical protein
MHDNINKESHRNHEEILIRNSGRIWGLLVGMIERRNIDERIVVDDSSMDDLMDVQEGSLLERETFYWQIWEIRMILED